MIQTWGFTASSRAAEATLAAAACCVLLDAVALAETSVQGEGAGLDHPIIPIALIQSIFY